MTADDKLAPICRQIWERAVEGRDERGTALAGRPTTTK